jgi:hypothetical protein
MSQYFDKDFVKFFLGFVAIISVSLLIIVATKLYEQNKNTQTANVLDSVKKNP